MKYHYEAVPVLFNILLFFLMLYPFPNVYRYGCEFRKRYTDILDYAVYGVLLILFCQFPISNPCRIFLLFSLNL